MPGYLSFPGLGWRWSLLWGDRCAHLGIDGKSVTKKKTALVLYSPGFGPDRTADHRLLSKRELAIYRSSFDVGQGDAAVHPQTLF